MLENPSVHYFLSVSGKSPFKEFLDSLSKKQQTKILRIFLLIENYGLIAIASHLKKVEGYPFYEIRIIGKDNIRVIYFLENKKTIIALHGFIKKTQKTPQRELTIALKRYQECILTNDIIKDI